MKSIKISFNSIENVTLCHGTKAEVLHRLFKSGINVPEAVFIDVRYFLEAYKISGMSQFYGDSDYHTSARPAVQLNMEEYVFGDAPVMVRSSIVPVGEYDEEFSSAISGAYDSVFVASYNELVDAVWCVWESAFSERAYNQLHLFAEKYEILGMGIIIQKYIPPKISGLFHSLGNECFDVNWIYGHLSDLVSGNKRGNQITCYENVVGDCILSGVEDSILQIVDGGFTHTFQQLTKWAIALRKLFDFDIEVEWLVDNTDGRIWFVQSQKLI